MGSLFKTPKAPQPMDTRQILQRSADQNTANAQQNAAFNRLNQADQYGNTLTYSQAGTDANGNPIFEARQSLGETGQMYAGGLANLGRQYMERAGSGLPSSQGAIDQAYQYATANLEPRFQRATDAMENKLRNQGLDPTSEAYKSQMADLGLQQNEARNNLVSSLQGQMFNQGLAARQQQMQELQPGMAFGNQTLSPSLINAPGVNVQNTDVAGLEQAAYNQQMQQYQQQMQQRNAMLGGLASIGGAIARPLTGYYFPSTGRTS